MRVLSKSGVARVERPKKSMQRHKHSCHHSRNREHNEWWIEVSACVLRRTWICLASSARTASAYGVAKELETRLTFRSTTLPFYRIGALRLEHSRYGSPKLSQTVRCNGIFAKLESSWPMSAVAVVPFPKPLLLVWSTLFPRSFSFS
jgi:hypothetical protein